MANNDFDLDKSFDGVYFLKKSNNGKILYSSKGLSKTCSSALDDTSSVIYDDESERYFYLKKQQNNDGIQAVFIDITEQILTINKLRGGLSEKDEEISLLKQTIEKLKLDSVTGLSVRGETLEDMKDYIRYANSNKEPFAVVMIDIDHFKNVNDTYGHLIGDKVLRNVADTLKGSIRQTPGTRKKDIIGRYGGEEFIILLKNIDSEYAPIVADRIRSRIESSRIFVESFHIPVTVSCGVSYCADGIGDMESVISASDSALYQSKENGRNCTTVSKPSKIKAKKLSPNDSTN